MSDTRIIDCGPNSPARKRLGATRIRRRGGSGGDQVFTLSIDGGYNVTQIARALSTGDLPRVTVDAPIDDAMMAHLRMRDLDMGYIEKMDPLRVLVPGILLATPRRDKHGNTVTEIIDGAHRAFRAFLSGGKTFRMFVVPEELMDPYRVTWDAEIRGKWQRLTGQQVLDFTWGTYTRVAP